MHPRPLQGHRAVPDRPPAGRSWRQAASPWTTAAGTRTATTSVELRRRSSAAARPWHRQPDPGPARAAVHGRRRRSRWSGVEFGAHFPGRSTPSAGRDHWSPAMSALVAGGGLKMGQAIGSTNARGEFPKDPQQVTVPQLLSTLYHAVGIDPAQTFNNGGGRPMYILDDRAPVTES